MNEVTDITVTSDNFYSSLNLNPSPYHMSYSFFRNLAKALYRDERAVSRKPARLHDPFPQPRKSFILLVQCLLHGGYCITGLNI